jgi:hypothetical protein
MSFSDFVAHRIADYPRVHRTRANLALHLFAGVPLFWAGLALIAIGAARLSWVEAAAGAACVLGSLVLEGAGHKRETETAEPFKGPLDFVIRYTFEQLFVFPHFVATGGWARAWRQAGRATSA